MNKIKLLLLLAGALLSACGGGGSSSGSSGATNQCSFNVSGSNVNAIVSSESLDFVKVECNQSANLLVRVIRECGIPLITSDTPSARWNGNNYEIKLQGATNIIPRGGLPRAVKDISIFTYFDRVAIPSGACPVN